MQDKDEQIPTGKKQSNSDPYDFRSHVKVNIKEILKYTVHVSRETSALKYKHSWFLLVYI